MPVQSVWALTLYSQLTAPPAYDNAQVYFPIDGNRLVAYRLPAGTQSWMVSAQPLMEPAAGEGLVFLNDPGVLRALHAADGSIAWEVPLTETLAVPPVWDNGWLIVASEGGEVGAFRASDGQLVWRRDIKSPAHARPALAGDRVYVPTADGRIIALHVADGEPVWERRLGGTPNDVLALDERLYVGGQDNFFYCLMTVDGRVDWRWRTGGDVIGRPIADDHRVYFVALDNVLRAMNLKSGGQDWMRPLPLRPVTGPVRVGSSIVVTGQAALLHVYNVKDGLVAGGGTIAPGIPPPTAKPFTVSAFYANGDPPRVDLAATDLWSLLPGTIPPEVGPPAALPFVNLANDAEVAAPPHVLEDPQTHLPGVLMITRDIARGAAVTMITRDMEPALSPVAALPNLIQIAPTTPTSPLRP
jgi:outer membrane protein assembly factor BamB